MERRNKEVSLDELVESFKNIEERLKKVESMKNMVSKTITKRRKLELL